MFHAVLMEMEIGEQASCLSQLPPSAAATVGRIRVLLPWLL